MQRGLCLLIVFALSAATASAGLLGSNINVCWNTVYAGAVTTDTGQCDNGTVGFTSTFAVVADPGTEFTSAAGSRQVDFTDTTVTVRYLSFSGSPSPDLFIFTGLPGTITGMTLLTSNLLNVSYATAPTSVGLLVSSPECCTTFTAEVTYQIDSSAAEVPEPGTFVVAGLGLAALGIGRRRLRR